MANINFYYAMAPKSIRGLIYKTLRRFHPKSVRRHKSLILHTHKSCQIYKTMCTPEPAQKSLYKSKLGEDCAYVHLHPDSSLKSPYMELTTPCFTMHIPIHVTPCLTPSKVQDIKKI